MPKKVHPIWSIITATQNHHVRERQYRRKKKVICYASYRKSLKIKSIKTPKEAVFKISSHSDDGGSRRY